MIITICILIFLLILFRRRLFKTQIKLPNVTKTKQQQIKELEEQKDHIYRRLWNLEKEYTVYRIRSVPYSEHRKVLEENKALRQQIKDHIENI